MITFCCLSRSIACQDIQCCAFHVSFIALLWSSDFSTLLDLATSSNLEQMPVDQDSLASERLLDALRDGGVVVGSESEDGRACSGEADAEEAGMRLRGVGGEDEGETGDLERNKNSESAKV